MAMAIQGDALEAVGLSRHNLEHLSALEPEFAPAVAAQPETLPADSAAASQFFAAGQALLDRLPRRAQRSEREQTAVEALTRQLREVRVRFLRSYAALLFAQLTDDRRAFVRIE